MLYQHPSGAWRPSPGIEHCDLRHAQPCALASVRGTSLGALPLALRHHGIVSRGRRRAAAVGSALIARLVEFRVGILKEGWDKPSMAFSGVLWCPRRPSGSTACLSAPMRRIRRSEPGAVLDTPHDAAA